MGGGGAGAFLIRIGLGGIVVCSEITFIGVRIAGKPY